MNTFITNTANSTVGATISGLPTAKILRREVLEDGDWEEMTGGSFAVSMAALEVRCYKFVREPRVCGDEGTVYNDADITGSTGQKDCTVSLPDFINIANGWLD